MLARNCTEGLSTYVCCPHVAHVANTCVAAGCQMQCFNINRAKRTRSRSVNVTPSKVTASALAVLRHSNACINEKKKKSNNLLFTKTWLCYGRFSPLGWANELSWLNQASQQSTVAMKEKPGLRFAADFAVKEHQTVAPSWRHISILRQECRNTHTLTHTCAHTDSVEVSRC